MNPPAQESRTQTIGISVTPTEKRLVEIVLLRHPEIDGASNLLRSRSLDDVLAEGREILRLIGGDRAITAGADEGAEQAAA
jgi:hypothetical protein